MEWYYAKNGQQLGPVSQESLLELFQSGSIQRTDLVWNETMTEWLPLGTIPGLTVPPAVSSEFPPPQTYAAPASSFPTAGPGVLSPKVSSDQLSPPTYLWQSIVCIFLCCWPFAIPAIVFGTKVKPAMDAGNYDAALEASKQAKKWLLISVIVGLIFNLIVFVISVLAGLAESSSYQ
ncbi:MAG: CD225/dispanin family protein [Verrucomicrobiales bacterium]|nr:CD225/dispanin family protein [Verrucomicrobiales bacterium]HQW27570.1 CD225/dispanin family protein [Verrucomicrobiales bacterium]